MKGFFKFGVWVLMAAVLSAVSVQAQDSGTKKAVASLSEQIKANKNISDGVKNFAIKTLVPTLYDKTYVEPTIAQNAKGVSLDKIKEIDKAWMAAESQLPIQTELMANNCAKALAALAKKHVAILEAFVMDNQGAVVCENALTSDYWQGDEAKWQKSFNGGKGGVDVGKIKFDKSANAKLQQVSLPIFGEGGKIIGAVTFGLAVERL